MLIISLLIWKAIDSTQLIETIVKVSKPFLWAFIIAFFLNTLLKILEKNFKLKRWVNILIIYLIFYGTIVLFITIITPKVVDSIKNLTRELPYYAAKTEEWLSKTPDYLKGIDSYGILDNIKTEIDNVFLKLGESITPILNKTVSQLLSWTSNLINFILGSIISIYILKDKEYFVRNIKKLIYAVFPIKQAARVLEIFDETQKAFSKFFVGKMIDSLIIGILCFIGCSIMRVHYALLISLIVGITNMIPYFGPFIGAIPSIIITLFYSPFKALLIMIFIFLLQQFDGLYLGPKILGIQVGLKPFWIILSIIIGGGFFGVWGMLFAVPIAAVVKSLVSKYIDNQFKQKRISLDKK
ncbi:AI-2E family transporter [Keratinibaculum paraultunense]|uniref:AI-2E family transporter n=1 Tax=Keratinibaculum paraultunense TaxID=1278232 RepID=UPI001304B222|nr:AI-2E family transporter [Keratinibaculum paraultunense]QQY80042.1 AI-2E family transporter [Keratinibaculum paraultunense]